MSLIKIEWLFPGDAKLIQRLGFSVWVSPPRLILLCVVLFSSVSFPEWVRPPAFQPDLLFAVQTSEGRARALGGGCSWPVAQHLHEQDSSNTFRVCNHREVPHQVI